MEPPDAARRKELTTQLIFPPKMLASLDRKGLRMALLATKILRLFQELILRFCSILMRSCTLEDRNGLVKSVNKTIQSQKGIGILFFLAVLLALFLVGGLVVSWKRWEGQAPT